MQLTLHTWERPPLNIMLGPALLPWVVALLVMVPIAFAVSSVLTHESQRPLEKGSRPRCLCAVLLLLLGLAGALSILHVCA